MSDSDRALVQAIEEHAQHDRLERMKPPGWDLVQAGMDGGAWRNPKARLTVIASVARELDGKRWLHVSIAHPKRMPRYDELTYVKRHWIGDGRKAIMVFPERKNHVNIHEFCLHLWCCLDGDGLPELSRGMGTI